ncbi:Major facilitator superfamily domain-containing protein 8 [Hondaea fermentalgiana]|uniref:Major facilitator superfamily domain-containing protein 8 n=1 Tax=Hondaea fermentalgiana TaxID=2315210 RepID=A0A2R5G2T7_9STRA|nr:Major facilitator superfamily domain-containing protein 8 [Hondaea fermentalgiana]|eukprot:GBG25346.1 Major facilitator superfamily domain-containing protein 8 [Hondaea fermentalgiana]
MAHDEAGRARPLLATSEGGDTEEDSFQRTRVSPSGADWPPSPSQAAAAASEAALQAHDGYYTTLNNDESGDEDAEGLVHAKFWEEFKRSYTVLALLGFVDAIEYGVVMPSLFSYLIRIDGGTHADATINYQYGVILSVFSFASLLSKPVLGYLVDKRPYLETLVWSTLVAIVGNLLYFLAEFIVEQTNDRAHAFAYLLTARALAGVGCGNTSLIFAYIARTAPSSIRTRYMTLLSMGKIIGFLFGPALNALTSLMVFSVGSLSVDERNAPGLFTAGVLVILIGLLCAFLREPPAYSTIAGRSDSELANVTSIWRIHRYLSVPVLLCFFNVFFYNFEIGCLESFAVPTASIAFKWSALQNSYVFLVITVTVLVNSSIVIATSGKVEERLFLLLSGILAVLGSIAVRQLYFYDMATWQFWIGTVLWGFPISLAIPSNRTIFSRLIEDSQLQGLLNSSVSVFASLGGALGPIYVGFTLGKRPAEPEHVRVAPATVLGCLFLSLLTLLANLLVLYIWPSKKTLLASTLQRDSSHDDDDNSNHNNTDDNDNSSIEGDTEAGARDAETDRRRHLLR